MRYCRRDQSHRVKSAGRITFCPTSSDRVAKKRRPPVLRTRPAVFVTAAFFQFSERASSNSGAFISAMGAIAEFSISKNQATIFFFLSVCKPRRLRPSICRKVLRPTAAKVLRRDNRAAPRSAFALDRRIRSLGKQLLGRIAPERVRRTTRLPDMVPKLVISACPSNLYASRHSLASVRLHQQIETARHPII